MQLLSSKQNLVDLLRADFDCGRLLRIKGAAALALHTTKIKFLLKLLYGRLCRIVLWLGIGAFAAAGLWGSDKVEQRLAADKVIEEQQKQQQQQQHR